MKENAKLLTVISNSDLAKIREEGIVRCNKGNGASGSIKNHKSINAS